MFEFGVRVLLAGAVVLLAGATGMVGLPLAAGVAGGVGGLALAGYALHERSLYEGAGAGLHAGLEGLMVALLLAGMGRTESLGFLTLVPHAWAVARRGSLWEPGACAAAFALVAANALVEGTKPGPALLIQASGVLGLGLLLALRRPPASAAESVVETVIVEDPELKGRFRALREAYTFLERRSEGDAHAAALARAASPEAIAQALRDATGATGALLFAPTEAGWEVFGRAGHVPDDLSRPFSSALPLQDRGAVLLFAEGQPVGAVWLPEESREGLAGVAETLAARLGDRQEIETERRRRRAVEVRLALVEGDDSPEAVARALAARVGADSVEFGVIGPRGVTPVGRFGPPCGLPDALRHETGPGLEGWAAAGGPMVWISDARADARLDGAASLRARTAALALLSVADGRAYVWAAWHGRDSARPAALSTLRAAEGVVLRWVEDARGRTYGLAA